MKMDRVEIRRKNFIPTDAFPYQTPVALQYDSGDYFSTLDMALKTRTGPASKAAGRSQEARQAARHRHLHLSRSLRHRAVGGGGQPRRPRRPL
jgi:carbon-monoxide dehydrogenase large subunit